MSQNRMLLSKWPEMMVDPAPSDVTKSLHDEPANFVSVPVEIEVIVDLFTVAKSWFDTQMFQ